jgi:protein gp37
LNWLIIGGESGTDARRCDLNWIRELIHQGQAAGVATFVKQLGGNLSDYDLSVCAKASGRSMHHPKGGDINEWPADLRVREFPNT